MKKVLCLCVACLVAFATTAQARVEFIIDDSGNGLAFKAPKSGVCPKGTQNYGGRCVPVCDKTEYPFAKNRMKPKVKRNSVIGYRNVGNM